MTDHTLRINQAKMAAERMKTDRIKAEQNKENLLKRRGEVEDEVRQWNVEPDQLDAEVIQQDAEIAADLATVEGMIPAQYRS
jgi:transposase